MLNTVTRGAIQHNIIRYYVTPQGSNLIKANISNNLKVYIAFRRVQINFILR